MKMIQALLIGLTIFSGGILNATKRENPAQGLNWTQFCIHKTTLQAGLILQDQEREVTPENVIAVRDQAVEQVNSIPRETLERQFIEWQTSQNY